MRLAPTLAQGNLELMHAPLPADKPLAAWEIECHALFACLSKAGRLTTDELRRAVEALPRQAHESWGYYEKWSAALAHLLVERGLVAAGELEAECFGDDTPPSGAVCRLKDRWLHIRSKPIR